MFRKSAISSEGISDAFVCEFEDFLVPTFEVFLYTHFLKVSPQNTNFFTSIANFFTSYVCQQNRHKALIASTIGSACSDGHSVGPDLAASSNIFAIGIF